MALELEHISKSFGVGKKRHTVIEDFSMRVEQGEMVAIVGKKRSGKTTLLQILCGLTRPDEGVYRLDGKVLRAKSKRSMARLRKKEFGVITREPILIENMTVYENLMLPLHHRFLSEKKKKARAKDVLRSLGLKGKGRFYPEELSMLERQKVCTARAMMAEPSYLIADEPTALLEGDEIEKYLDILEILHNAGCTVILGTYSKRVAYRCERIIPITGQSPDGIPVEAMRGSRSEPVTTTAGSAETAEGAAESIYAHTLAGTVKESDAAVEPEERSPADTNAALPQQEADTSEGVEQEVPSKSEESKTAPRQAADVPDLKEDDPDEELEKNLLANLDNWF